MILFRSPSPALVALYLAALSAALAALFVAPLAAPVRYLEIWLGLLLVPTALAGLGTAPLARALGGSFSLPRALLLTLFALLIETPLWAVAHLWNFELPGLALGMGWIVLLAQGPVLWFRELSLFGVSNPSHARSLPPALLQPLATLAGASLLLAWSPAALAAAAIFLLLGFLAAVQLIRATDRPLRREFQTSGIALLRPTLDHVADRDAAATATLEAFFARFAIRADLSATMVEFRGPSGPTATIALPTVHPGPFAALGASNLPQRAIDRLGPSAGVVLVPHTPCNHELDLPTSRDTARVLDALAELRTRLVPGPSVASPLVEGRPGGLARAQRLGGTYLVLVSQAPAPTDDIAFAVGDALRRQHAARGGAPMALIDAHNSYVEDRGDIAYGSVTARQLAADVEAAVAAADAATATGPIEVGAAHRPGPSPGARDVGPAGFRAIVVRAAGRTTAYVLIDGNNLVLGARARILEALRGVVDDAEVMTTDNHIVHEVDGTSNPVGAKSPAEELAADCRALVEAAKAELGPVEVLSGSAEIGEVSVLGPSWTERLLTSLGDTVSVLGHQALTTLLLLLVSSLVVLLAVR